MRNPPGVSPRQRRWIFAGITAWILIGTVVGEFRDPPFHLVRFLLNLVLGALTVWVLVWFFTRPFFVKGKD